MKRLIAVVLGFALSAFGVLPANALGSELGPSGLPDAWKDGFNGSGLEVAVISEDGFQLKNRNVKSAVISEACFADEMGWLRCNGDRLFQEGKGSSINKDAYDYEGDNLIYSLVGSKDAIAPKTKFHAIRSASMDLSLDNAILHALTKDIQAIVIPAGFYRPERGFEVNCDANYPSQVRAVAQATALGIPTFVVSGESGDSYGLSYPACLTGVIPVGNLGFDLELAQGANVGPGVVLAQSYFNTLYGYTSSGKDELTKFEAPERALAVVLGVYGALLDLGHSREAALEAIQEAGRRIDDIIVKDIPVVDYTSAKKWLEAKGQSSGATVGSTTQVSKTDIVATLSTVPAKKSSTLVTGYEIYDFETSSWQRTSIAKSKATAVRLNPGASSGWVRLVLSRSGKTAFSSPATFSLSSDFSSSSKIGDGIKLAGVPLHEFQNPEFPQDNRSTFSWPEISDPAADLLELDYARQMQITGKGVTVAIIDDGIQADHPYFDKSRIVAELCLVVDNSCPNGQNRQTGRSAAAAYDWGDGYRDDHGTMVAGTIGGFPTDLATGGIAPEVNFIIARVDLNGGDEQGSYIDQALEWILSLTEDYNIAAVNMSFGSTNLERDAVVIDGVCADNPEFESTSKALRERGVAPVVASGNDGFLNIIGGPACESSAIAVGATDNDGSVINYSNISQKVEMLAPARMKTSLNAGVFDEGSGTSNSTPVVAGAFALAKQLRPDLSVDEVLYAMQQSADMVDDIYVKDIPRLNIRKFLEYITPGSELDGQSPSLSVKASGVSCEATFDANGGTSPLLRYRPVGSSTWWQISSPEKKTVLTGLAAKTTYEIEVGVIKDDKILWSSREDCTTASGGKPGKVSGVIIELRGKDWAVAYVPTNVSNGYAVTELSYKVGSKTMKATWLGSDRFLLSSLSSQKKLKVSLAFANSKGLASYSSLSIPAYAALDYTSVSLVSSSSSSKLSSSQKNELKAELSSFGGVKTITCTAMQEKKSSSSFKKSVKSRADDACKYVKTLHKSARVVVKTKDVSDKNLAGVVQVVISGKN